MPSRLCCLAAACALAAGVLTSCTSDDPPAAGDSVDASNATSTASSVRLTQPNAPLDVRIEQLRGGVKRSDRGRLTRALAKPVAIWFDGGYVGGDYPREDFTPGFRSWTAQAAALGARDRAVTTNAALGRQSVGVVANVQRVRLYVFATRGVVGGATARVLLRLTIQQSDGSLNHVAINGDLSLTRRAGVWKIFGYNLDRSVRA